MKTNTAKTPWIWRFSDRTSIGTFPNEDMVWPLCSQKCCKKKFQFDTFLLSVLYEEWTQHETNLIFDWIICKKWVELIKSR